MTSNFRLESRSVETYPNSDLEFQLYDQKASGDVVRPNANANTLSLQNGAPSAGSLTKRNTQRRNTLPPQQPLGLFPFSTSFFDNSPAAIAARKLYMKMAIGGTVMIILIIFSAFPIYWGSTWKTPNNVHKLNGFVVDFDGSTVGSAVSAALGSATFRGLQFITWQNVSASSYPGGLDQFADDIVEEKSWVGVAIPANATQNLMAAAKNADPTYNSTMNTIIGYGVEARNNDVFWEVLYPEMSEILDGIAAEFALNFAKQLTTSGVNVTQILANAPQIVTAPLTASIVNIKPFDVPVATAVTFVGLIYLLILSFMVVMLLASARDITGLERGLTLKSLIILRVATPIAMYFVISLFYSLLSLAFQVPFSRKFGHSGFIVFWMLQYVGMLTLGLALEAMLALLTLKGIPFFLVLWIITNVSTAAVPMELLPGVFKYGYAYPFYNFGRAVRTILFSTKNEVGLNFGVLFAWVGVSMLTIPLFTFISRRGAMKTYKAQQTANAAM